MPDAGLAYSRDSNDSWLDELVSGIITPSNRTPSRSRWDDRDWENSPFGTPDSLAFHATWVNPRSALDWPAQYHPRLTQPDSPTRSEGPKGHQTQLSLSNFSLRLSHDWIGASQPSTPAKQTNKWSFDDVRSTRSATPRCQPQPRSSSLDFARKSPRKDSEPQRSPALAPLQLEAAESVPMKQPTPLQKIPEESSPSNTSLSQVSPASSAGSRTSSQPKRSTWSAFPRASVAESVGKTSPASDKTVLHVPQVHGEKNVFNAQDPQIGRPSSKMSNAEEAMKFKPHPAVRLFSDRAEFSLDVCPSYSQPRYGALGQLSVLAAICLSVFVVALDRNTIATAIPRITASFHSFDDIGWYGSAYLMTVASAQPLYGRVYTSFDVRWTFLAALGMFEIGSLISAISPNSGSLIFGRAIQGFGSAGVLTGAYVVGTRVVPRPKLHFLIASLGVLSGLGGTFGPLLGGVFADLVTWRWAFWINLPAGGLIFAVVFFCLRPQPSGEKTNSSWTSRILTLDPIGNAILVVACVMLFLALQLAEMSNDWKSSRCVGLICGFSVAVISLLCWTVSRGDAALIPPRLLRQRTVAASCGTAFFVYGATVVHTYFLPIWFQAVRGDSAILSGAHTIPYMLTYALASSGIGIFAFKDGLIAPFSILGTTLGIAGASLFTLLDRNCSTGAWIGFQIVVSAGLGITLQQSLNAVQIALHKEDLMIGTVAVVWFQSLGGAVFVSVGDNILRNNLFNKHDENTIPNAEFRTFLSAGATAFRSTASAEDLSTIVDVYNTSLRKVFISAVVLCCCAFLCSLWIEWRRLDVRPGLPEEREDKSKA